MKRHDNINSIDDSLSEESIFESDLGGVEADAEEATIPIKKKYKQKPRKAWCSDPHLKDWIIIDEDQVKCRFCNKMLNVKFSSLKSHAYSQKHLRAERRYKEGDFVIEKEEKYLSDYDDDPEQSTSLGDIDNIQSMKVEKDDIPNNPIFLKSRPKKRKRSVSVEKNSERDDFMAMRIALEKDKIKAIGDMSKQISSSIRYLADSIRLVIQNSNSLKSDNT